MMFKKLITISIVIILTLSGCGGTITTTDTAGVSFKDGANVYYVPEYGNEPIYNFNEAPYFAEFILKERPYEEYNPLDSLGRCTLTSAICCKETMPKDNEKRGSISNVTPTGWIQAKYDNISGKYLYNRCHLIGWQLTAENDNKRNLITGTKYLNIDGMLPIENSVAKHIKETEHYVAYQVTPIYDSQGLLPLGVHMEVDCINCDIKGTTYNVFCYNVQPGIELDYKTGNSKELN